MLQEPVHIAAAEAAEGSTLEGTGEAVTSVTDLTTPITVDAREAEEAQQAKMKTWKKNFQASQRIRYTSTLQQRADDNILQL